MPSINLWGGLAADQYYLSEPQIFLTQEVNNEIPFNMPILWIDSNSSKC